MHTQTGEIRELQETVGQSSREGCWGGKKGRKSLKTRFFALLFPVQRSLQALVCPQRSGCSACLPGGGNVQNCPHSSPRSAAAVRACVTGAQIAASLPLIPRSRRFTWYLSSFPWPAYAQLIASKQALSPCSVGVTQRLGRRMGHTFSMNSLLLS